MDKSNEYVVAIGGSNIDIIGQPYEKLIFKNSNKSKINLSSGGVIRNIAENLSKLNSKCHLITVFGNDDFGSFLENVLSGCWGSFSSMAGADRLRPSGVTGSLGVGTVGTD